MNIDLDPRDFGDQRMREDRFPPPTADNFARAVAWALFALLVAAGFTVTFGPWLAEILRDWAQ